MLCYILVLVHKLFKRIDRMQDNQNRGISRRGFLKGVGAGVGLIGLSQATGNLIGCGSPLPSSLLNGQEMVGKITSNASTIKLVAGDLCQPSTQFRLLYDTVSRTNPMDYTNQTSEVTGFSPNDPIAFDLTSLS